MRTVLVKLSHHDLPELDIFDSKTGRTRFRVRSLDQFKERLMRSDEIIVIDADADDVLGRFYPPFEETIVGDIECLK